MSAWNFLKQHLGIDRPMDLLERDDAIDLARERVRGGYESRSEIISSVQDVIRPNYLTHRDIVKIVDKQIKILLKEQASWPAVTDYDRLHLTMLELDQKGIVAREDFSCCGTCGAAEIWDEIDEARSNGLNVRGYVFFHQQGTESAVDGGSINFSYGSAVEDASEADKVAIGQELADAIRSAGLNVDWDGQLSMCVMVDVDWKRRWTAKSFYD